MKTQLLLIRLVSGLGGLIITGTVGFFCIIGKAEFSIVGMIIYLLPFAYFFGDSYLLERKNAVEWVGTFLALVVCLSWFAFVLINFAPLGIGKLLGIVK